MSFISKVDHKTFSTKEELLKHLMENFVEVVEDDQGEIIKKIYSNVPMIKVESIEEEGGVLKLNIVFQNEDGKHLKDEQLIIGIAEANQYYGQNIFKTIDEAIQYMKTYYETSDEIKEMLEKEFGVTHYELESLYTGGFDSSPMICFKFDKDGETYQMQYDFSDTLEILYNQIKANFTNIIEGEVENYWCTERNQQLLRVSGVYLENFLKHGEKVKIEILT